MPGCTHWAAFERRPTTVWSEREVCLLLWKTENGSCLMAAARSTRAPSTVVVVKCSLLDWHFQVQIVCECCSRQSSSVQDASAGCWWTNAGCCSEQVVSFRLLDKLSYHYSTLPPVFPSMTLCYPLLPLPAPEPSPLPLPLWLLASTGRGSPHVPRSFKAHIIDQCRFRPLWLMWEILYFCINVYWL